ncbi:hypothetical protein FA10DRAFT_152986 [Acaromyces ingoldii]|uniref:Uncharacterized protein n=1 Tax=Acaromyces ingoldii TaxID=215250 RepID=A0A316YGS0_9BASI|nr:hypothetical protein FA10DRAFT_152986 [Acaromyces ingoldii]PWN88044.1 hypothetical protein FA10DRAFT_152986 [Acaromyces ingoldii]
MRGATLSPRDLRSLSRPSAPISLAWFCSRPYGCEGTKAKKMGCRGSRVICRICSGGGTGGFSPSLGTAVVAAAVLLLSMLLLLLLMPPLLLAPEEPWSLPPLWRWAPGTEGVLAVDGVARVSACLSKNGSSEEELPRTTGIIPFSS